MRPENRRPLVRRRPAERQLQLHRPPPAQRGEQPAFIWEGDDPPKSAHHLPRTAPERLPPGQCAEKPWREKGDRVCIYMPMIPEAAYAMLACTRIGAVHSVVFGGFSPTPARPDPRRRLPHRDHRR
jgi:acyl-coenzyme A synthetase/AMP-(fatty) acid ligase